MKVFIVGDTGLLGQAFIRYFKANVSGASSSELDPTLGLDHDHFAAALPEDFETLRGKIASFQPDWIINCLAIVNLARCESEPKLAEGLHADLAGQLAGLAKKVGSGFVQISTDQVFDGQKKSPYVETDATRPLNQYGKTKASGEKKVLEANPESLILRTNIVGFRNKAGSPTFGEWLTSALAKKETITLFHDYVASSIHVDDFVRLAHQAMKLHLKGIYHLASKTPLSKLEFGRLLAKEMGVSGEGIKEGSLQEAALKPARPGYLALDTTKGEKDFQTRFPEGFVAVQKLAQDFEKSQGGTHVGQRP